MYDWIAPAAVGVIGVVAALALVFVKTRKSKAADLAAPSSSGAKQTANHQLPPRLPDIVPGSMKQSSKPVAGRFKKICLVCNREFPEDYNGKCPEDGVALNKIADNLAPGSKFSEYYEILSPLGTGGLSRVFLARHISSNREVALKLLHSHLAADTSSIQRFQREAKTLSKLSHPNLVTVEDFMISPDGIPFIVMEYLEGESLQNVLKREGKIAWRDSVELFLQICKGLSHAHNKGIIHRDLKPGNIMLVPNKGSVLVKVVDFGLVKSNDVDSMGRITATGEVFGSPMYMSPEQCQGRPVDRRSDVYALGCLLYECLAGHAPFVGANVIETLSMQLKSPVPELPAELQLPAWLSDAVKKSLNKDPDARFQSIDDFGGALQDGLSMAKR
jgi:serine/threonine protein kinase